MTDSCINHPTLDSNNGKLDCNCPQHTTIVAASPAPKCNLGMYCLLFTIFVVFSIIAAAALYYWLLKDKSYSS